MLMEFELRLSGYYGDSPAEGGGFEGYREISSARFAVLRYDHGNTDASVSAEAWHTEVEAVRAIDEFIADWVTAERFECYTVVETERQRSFFRYELLRALDEAVRAGLDAKDVPYAYSMTDETAFVYNLRLYNNTNLET
jgi:hypothetical protein